MKQAFSWLAVILGMVLVLVFLLGDLSDSKAAEFRAQAVLVNAQSSARMDYLTGVMPYVVMGLGVMAFAVISLFLIAAVVAVLGLSEYGRTIRQIHDYRGFLCRSIVMEIPGSPRQFYKRVSAGQKYIIDG